MLNEELRIEYAQLDKLLHGNRYNREGSITVRFKSLVKLTDLVTM